MLETKSLLKLLTLAPAIMLVIGLVSIVQRSVQGADDVRPEIHQNNHSVPDFRRDIRPLLSDRCFACHGPDAAERAAGLRLDTAGGISRVVDLDDPGASELISRIDSEDPGTVMPPPRHHKTLSSDEKEMLRRWVASGAKFEEHWAFVPLKPKSSPAMTPAQAARKIDDMVNQRLESERLVANGRADRSVLLRRACLDLTGLPPDHGQRQAFLSDDSDQAYERLIDRLLSTPAYGEHMGRYWLDLVRYADTHGLHYDNYREMWPYRDWVIDAFGANMPFDQFVTKQLAGDLVPGSTRDDKVASGFNRLNLTTNEGGSIYEEVLVRNCVDRTDAFGTVFLGLTVGCAACHDHKFDPVTQRDYYSLLAFFNSLDGAAMDNNVKNPAPMITVPSKEQERQRDQLLATVDQLQTEMTSPIESVDVAQSIWDRRRKPRTMVLRPTELTTRNGTNVRLADQQVVEVVGDPADQETVTFEAPVTADIQWSTLRLDALVDDPGQQVGTAPNGNAFLSEIVIELADELSGGAWTRLPIDAAFADFEQHDSYAIVDAIDGIDQPDAGWAVGGHQKAGPRTAWFSIPTLVPRGNDAKLRIELKYESPLAGALLRKIRLKLSEGAPPVPADQQVELGPIHVIGPLASDPQYSYKPLVSQDEGFDENQSFKIGSRFYRWQHRGDLDMLNRIGMPILDRPSVSVFHQSIDSPRRQKMVLTMGADDGYLITVNGKRIDQVRGERQYRGLTKDYPLELNPGVNDVFIQVINHGGNSAFIYGLRSVALPAPPRWNDVLKRPPADRTPADQQQLMTYFRTLVCDHPDWTVLQDIRRGTLRSIDKLNQEIPSTLVWRETPTPRAAHILRRGRYDQPGEKVQRGTPAFLPDFPAGTPRDRLGLARWLMAADHPLTARVAVNRFWQQVFGTGLVKTSEDFGAQGQPPSHPEVLDFLAVQFRDSGWDVKSIVKTIMMTEAYRRSAHLSAQHREVDPENRLLARGPRFRLDAEVLRDQALMLSGQLIQKIGGPGVKPDQPDGLWKSVAYSRSNTAKFVADQDDRVFRRSVYLFWKRTSPPPQLATLDAPSRESCTARRERTNTPLQALLMMNEPQYLGAASALVDRMMTQSNAKSDEERLGWIFKWVTCQPIEPDQHAELGKLLDDLESLYAEKPSLASELAGVADPHRAAWIMVASTLLNLDEVISK